MNIKLEGEYIGDWTNIIENGFSLLYLIYRQILIYHV